MSENKYQVIYADPPWWYNNRRWSGAPNRTRFGGGAPARYPLMKTEAICALPIADLADDNAVLFLWATWPRLPEAFKVIAAWGFEYKTLGFDWIKLNQESLTPRFGTGFYAKSNSEPCLLATRGETIKPARDDISSVVMSPIGEHSRKPDTVRHRIELMYPEAARVELFARPIDSLFKPFAGWDVWGNQIESNAEIAV